MGNLVDYGSSFNDNDDDQWTIYRMNSITYTTLELAKRHWNVERKGGLGILRYLEYNDFCCVKCLFELHSLSRVIPLEDGVMCYSCFYNGLKAFTIKRLFFISCLLIDIAPKEVVICIKTLFSILMMSYTIFSIYDPINELIVENVIYPNNRKDLIEAVVTQMTSFPNLILPHIHINPEEEGYCYQWRLRSGISFEIRPLNNDHKEYCIKQYERKLSHLWYVKSRSQLIQTLEPYNSLYEAIYTMYRMMENTPKPFEFS